MEGVDLAPLATEWVLNLQVGYLGIIWGFYLLISLSARERRVLFLGQQTA